MMKKGFTLIELLIVVAIIAILAAIAVPNFLEAQTRSRVSRAMNDLRTISLAMESYYVDNGGYPPSSGDSWLTSNTTSSYMAREHLTTPISYLNSIPADVFRVIGSATNPMVQETIYRVYAVNYGAKANGGPSYNKYPYNGWMTWTIGPDMLTNAHGYRTWPAILKNEGLGDAGAYGVDFTTDQPIGGSTGGNGLRYDPTNGTVSFGDIYRHEGEAKVRPG